VNDQMTVLYTTGAQTSSAFGHKQISQNPRCRTHRINYTFYIQGQHCIKI